MSRAETGFLSNRLYEPMNATANVFDVSSDAFVERVIDASRDTAVMVDFWAQWCGPCRALTPVLVRLVDEFAGQFRLAKVDTEAEPRLAADHGIRSLPTVKLFRNAVVVAEFSGLQPESFIRSLLEEHLPRESDSARDRAEALAGSGEVEAAIAVLQAAAASDPSNHRVHLDLAVLLVADEQIDAAAQQLRELPANRQQEPEVQALRARLQFARLAGDAPALAELTLRIESEPGDCEARHLLSARLAATGDYAGAMAELLEILRRDRKFGDDAGRKGLLAIFEVLDDSDPLIKQYQAEMVQVMY